jgi:streptogramin lyase
MLVQRPAAAQATLPNARPMHIVIDKASNLWVLEQRGVDRLTPNGLFTLYPTPIRLSDYAQQTNQGIAVTAQGDVWFVDGHGHLGRLNPQGRLRLFVPPTKLGTPFAIAITPDGTL